MRRLMLVLLCLTAMAGARADVLRIAAAADLAYCLEALNAAFSAQEPDADIRTSTGSSGNFFAQIRQGAPFDLFLSADMDYPRALVTAGLAEAGSLTPYATGRLALWTLRTDLDPARGLTVLQASSVHRIALANPDHAPYGRAARAALEKAGLWQALSPRLVLGENVAQAAQFIATGNADIGLVAASLLSSPQLRGRGRVWLLPPDAFPRLEQGAVLTRQGARSPLARRYLAFLRSPAARAIFERYGFLAPGTP
jgi:molybdate transport system substrate-binding protein